MRLAVASRLFEYMPAEPQFDVFISYSRKDAEFARLLQRALANYTPPRGLPVPQRRLRVFRDESDFQGVEYESALERNLKNASKLLLICSPASRASAYVGGEIRTFATLRGPEHIATVLVSGLPNNETQPEDERRAFHPELISRLAVPLAADYRGFDPKRDRPGRDRFEGAWYKLLADLYDVSRSDVEQREKIRQRRTRRIRTAIASASIAVLSSLTIWALISRREAIAQRTAAESRMLAAQSMSGTQPYDASLLLAEAAYRLSPNPQSWEALFTGLQRQPEIRQFLRGHGGVATDLAAGGGGACVAATTSEGMIVWDLNTGEVRARIPGRPTAKALGSSCDIAAAGLPDGAVQLWRITAAPSLKWSAPATGHPITSVAVSANRVAAGDGTGHLRLFAMDSGGIVAETRAGKGVDVLRFHSGALASVDLDRRFRTWSAQDLTPLGEPAECAGNAGLAAISSNLTRCAIGGGPNEPAAITNLNQPGSPTSKAGGDWTLALDFSPDGETLATGNQGGPVYLWDVRSQPQGKPRAALTEHVADVVSVVFAGNGTLVSSAGDGSVIVWSVSAADRLLSATSKRDRGVTVERAGEVFTGTADGRVFGVRQGVRRDFETTQREPILRLRLDPIGARLAAIAANGAVTVWNVADAKRLAVFPEDSRFSCRGLGIACDIAFAAGGLRAASVHNDVTAYYWTWNGSSYGQVRAPWEVHTNLTSVAFAPNGTAAAFGTSLYLGNVALFETLPAKEPTAVLTGHSMMDVTALAFSPDGRLLLSGGFDRRVLVWDVAGRRRIGEPYDLRRPIRDLAFAEDGLSATAVTEEGSVHRWNLNPSDWLDLACRIANRDLTAAERTRLLGRPDEPVVCASQSSP